MSSPAVLVLNAGSSSLKAGVFVADADHFAGERAVLTAEASGIGQGEGSLSIHDADGNPVHTATHSAADMPGVLQVLVEALQQHSEFGPVGAVGHRFVHGGARLRQHTLLTPAILSALRDAVHFAPLHLPSAIALIAQAQKLFPNLPQALCFDTAFHATLPPSATRLPIPERYAREGVQRYGFHGLSYESLKLQLSADGPMPERVILAHIGSGASLCALYRGQSVDTTMGLTPAGGVLMGTRSGDLDPGVLLFLARTAGLSAEQLESLVNHESGLKALAGTSDLRRIEAAMQDASLAPSQRAASQFAFAQFAESVAKAVAAFMVSLSGLDLLVFAGGIGEHSSRFRQAVAERLAAFGVSLDEAANNGHARAIHAQTSRVPVWLLPAREDELIASHTRNLARAEP